MSGASYQVILGMGGFFVLLGIIFILGNRREKRKYYNGVLREKDIKEVITHEHERFWLQAWMIGGRMSIAVGIALLIAGAILWHVGP
jgi:hypothetical protein